MFADIDDSHLNKENKGKNGKAWIMIKSRQILGNILAREILQSP